MTGYHTRWALPDADTEDPERIAIRGPWRSPSVLPEPGQAQGSRRASRYARRVLTSPG
jgi:hypothetical protein